MNTFTSLMTLGIALLIAALSVFFQAKVLQAEKQADRDKVLQEMKGIFGLLVWLAGAVIIVAFLLIIVPFIINVICT